MSDITTEGRDVCTDLIVKDGFYYRLPVTHSTRELSFVGIGCRCHCGGLLLGGGGGGGGGQRKESR